MKEIFINKDIRLINEDCLLAMDNLIAEGIRVDAIITDPPYGTTACKWDSIIPFECIWEKVKLLRKENTPVVLFGSQPFTSLLITSNLKNFKYEWIYKKRVASNFAQAKSQPLKEHENIVVFYKHKYYPIKEMRKGAGLQRARIGYKSNPITGEFNNHIKSNRTEKNYEDLKYPSSVQEFNNRASGDRGFHPTQKPLALMEYLIKTYTNEGDTVLDFTMGSGTTGIACVNNNRKFIGIEFNPEKNKENEYANIAKYFDVAVERIKTRVQK